VFACAVTHRGPYKNGPGEINVPVAIAGMPVQPGDIIVGDADGVVAVPLDIADRVLASATAIREKEAVVMQQIEAGTLDRVWVDETLRRKGYGLPQ
jgi:regulator of RNase E activity RraA